MAKKEKKKTQWGLWIGTVLMMLGGAFCGVSIALFLDARAGDGWSPGEKLLWLVPMLLGIYVCLFVQLVIHEAGHLVFGLLTGYRFSSFRIGSFIWVRDGERVRFKRLSIAGTGGQCLMEPPAFENGHFPFVLYNLGGSLMNIASSLLFLLLYILAGNKSVLGILSLMTAELGFALAVMNGIPMRMGMVDNDGYNALSLGKDPAARKAFWLQMRINEQATQGVRLKDMPEEWFPQPEDGELKNSMMAAIAVFRCNRLVDAHRFAEADGVMAHLMDTSTSIAGLHRNLMLCDRIYIELLGENRPDVVAGMRTKELEKFLESMKSFPSVIRTQYVYALLGEQDSEKAGKWKMQFEKTARTHPYPSDIQSERELMELADQKAAER